MEHGEFRTAYEDTSARLRRVASATSTGDHQEFRCLGASASASAVRTRLDAADVDRRRGRPPRTASAAHAGCSTPVHRSTSTASPCSSRTSVRSWLTPVAASNVGRLVVLHREVGAERATAPAVPPGCSAAAMPASTASSSPVGGHQPERSLAQADRRVELARRTACDRASSRSNVAPRRRVVASARSMNRWLMSMPCTTMPRAGQLVGMPSRTAADVEHTRPRLQAERVDDEVDLLHACPW